MSSKTTYLSFCTEWRRLYQPVWLCIALLSVLGLGAENALGQASPSASSGVSRTAKAVTSRRGGVAKVSLQGTNLMPGGTGEALVENKGNRVEIDVKFEGRDQETKFG